MKKKSVRGPNTNLHNAILLAKQVTISRVFWFIQFLFSNFLMPHTANAPYRFYEKAEKSTQKPVIITAYKMQNIEIKSLKNLFETIF